MKTTSALPVGTRLDEYRQFQDDQTGACIHQLSQHDSINHSLFFLSSSFRPGHPNQVVWITHRDGFPQVCLFDFATKQSQVLTEREDAQAFSGSFSHDGVYLYYSTTACEIRQLRIDTLDDESIVTMPNHHLGECSLNGDDTHIVTAAKHGDTHAVIVVDIQARQARVIHEADFKIIHPQFHPSNPSLIEYAGDPSPRLWTIERDGTNNQNLYPSTDKEFFVHESFLGGSDDLIFAIWPYRLCRLNIHEKKIHTIV
ncbi:MAG: oligogalacturonate lyase family protein, partial [Kiritimatiellae bacterium]|nr:oligogalacturonate lyase family protein [Kiritimatiellia bacterium]